MLKNNSGVDEAVVDTSTQVAAEQDNDVISIAELLEASDEADEKEDAPTEETGEQAQEDAPDTETDGAADHAAVVEQAQKRVKERENNAFAKRLAAEKSKLERDPVYQLGREFVARYGGDAAKAREAMMENQVKELAKDTNALAKFVVEQRFAAANPEPHADESDGGEETREQRARRIALDIANTLGDDVDLDAYQQIDPDFMRNCDLYGATVAVAKMAQRAHEKTKTAEKIEQNRKLPQSIRPSNTTKPKPVSFEDMTDAQFLEFERRRKQAQLEGKIIKFT